MDLTELTDEPELTVTIAGKVFRFSEVPIGGLAKLQAWIKANVPDPLVALRERLVGYPDSVVAQLTADARREAPTWPPIVGTAEGAMALMGNPQGQVQALWIGLTVHQPDATIEDADRVYRALKRQRDARLVKQIYATIFGTSGADDEGGSPDPKAPVAAVAQAVTSNGSSTSAQPSSASR